MNEDFITPKQSKILKKMGFDHYFTPTIYQTMKWMREEMGIDIVISPKFNSNTGDRVGYFWKWSQRTDVNMNPKTHKTYEKALLDAIETIIVPFEELYNTDKNEEEQPKQDWWKDVAYKCLDCEYFDGYDLCCHKKQKYPTVIKESLIGCPLNKYKETNYGD